LVALAGAAAVLAIYLAPSAVADSSNSVAVCSGEQVSGVEVDTCAPNPNANTSNDSPGVYPQFRQSFVLGIGG